jgi:hypothetical protein
MKLFQYRATACPTANGRKRPEVCSLHPPEVECIGNGRGALRIRLQRSIATGPNWMRASLAGTCF